MDATVLFINPLLRTGIYGTDEGQEEQEKKGKKEKVHSTFISQVHSQPYGHKLEAASSDNWNNIAFRILQKPLDCITYVERYIYIFRERCQVFNKW